MDKDLFTKTIVHITAVISVCIVLVNVICIAVILFTSKLRKKSHTVFIVNLLATHLIQGVFVLPIYAVKKAKTYPMHMYSFVCDTWRMTYMLTFYGTCINVLLVALDRFIATKFALSQKIRLKTKHCLIIVCLAWAYMLLLCLIPFVPLQSTAESLLRYPRCNYNQPVEWTIFMLMANTVLPFILSTFVYIYIIYVLKKSSVSLFQPDDSVTSRGNPSARKRFHVNKKLTTLTIKITATYGLTWLPSIVYYNIVAIAPDTFSEEFYVSDTESILTFTIKYITFFDAVLAPVLYCYNHREFRQAFQDICKKLRICQCKFPTRVDDTNVPGTKKDAVILRYYVEHETIS